MSNAALCASQRSIVNHLEITYVRAGRAAVTLAAHARRRLLPVRGAHGSVLCFFIWFNDCIAPLGLFANDFLKGTLCIWNAEESVVSNSSMGKIPHNTDYNQSAMRSRVDPFPPLSVPFKKSFANNPRGAIQSLNQMKKHKTEPWAPLTGSNLRRACAARVTAARPARTYVISRWLTIELHCSVKYSLHMQPSMSSAHCEHAYLWTHIPVNSNNVICT